MGAPTPMGGGYANIQFCQISPKNCMKLKEFGSGGASLIPPLDPPLARVENSTPIRGNFFAEFILP